MYDFRPALQLTNFEGIPRLYDLLNSRYFDIKDQTILPYLAALLDIVPDTLDNLALVLSENSNLTVHEAQLFCDTLIESGLLCSSDLIAAQKNGVQMWVDNSWIDALVLHFASRNLKYTDDPREFGGNGDTSYIADLSDLSDAISSEAFIGAEIKLSKPIEDISGQNILHSIMNRRSFKPFKKKKFNPGDLESILWFSNLYARERLISERELNNDNRDRVYDSAFSCLHSYVVLYEPLNDVAYTIPPGAYYYNVEKHSLRPVREGKLRTDIGKISAGQKRAGAGLFTIVLCADWENYGARYEHERSYRNLLINTAQLAQFYLVMATEHKFNTFITPAIQDEKMAELIGSGKSSPLYLVTAG